MKKLMLMLTLMTSILMADWGNEEAVVGQNTGIKIGATYSNIVGDDVSSINNNILGFELGVLMQHPINNQLSLQVELLFTQKGTSQSESGEYFNSSLNYMNVPILLSFALAPNISIYGGGYLSYLVSVSLSTSIDISSSDIERAEDDAKKSTSDIDAGFALGAMFKLNENLLFDLRFERGFATLDDDGDKDGFNQSFKLSAAWLF